jgi:phosphotransferase system enzyme I (PtsP)
MAVNIGGPRVLLRRLREIMAEPVVAQTRLDHIVKAVAANMVAEVCSIYIMRPDFMLELYATEGLKQESVHKTQLKVGEGLIGDIAFHARPLNLSDAQAHPNFAYRPETGEEIYHSLMGVPILRGGRVIGVVAVQNQTMRSYTEEEVEVLQTIAMVIAELVVGSEFSEVIALRPSAPGRNQALHMVGRAISGGIALGHVVLHEPRVVVERMVAQDIELEQRRLDKGLEELRQSIDNMLTMSEFTRAGEHRDVLEAYRMFAHDSGWISHLREAVDAGLTAEAAVEHVKNDTQARMARLTDPYLRERLHDLDDLANRLLRHLVGKAATAAAEALPDDAIIVARNMGPAELLDYERKRLRGLVMEEGSPTAHVSIVARALDIPCVTRVEGLLDATEPGDPIILDGDGGEVYLRPSQDIIASYADKARFRARRQAQYRAQRDEPAVTRDGREIYLNMNAGLLADMPHLEESGAAGIGLFRTELQFMISSALPRLAAQRELYRQILDIAGEKPVVFRTLDVGGDKVLPYMTTEREENPAMGWRSIRLALDRPGLLRYQLRALLQAAAGRELRVMFPMIATVAEFRAARRLLEREMKRLEKLGETFPVKVLAGSMLEVPSLVWQLDELFEVSDFVSVGSNDLVQFLFACDRQNPRLAGRYDLLSPAVLRLLSMVVERCGAKNIPLSLCGEMSGSPLEAMTLIGLGFRAISMPAAAIGPVKMMIRSLDAGRLEGQLKALIASSRPSLRNELAAFATEASVIL